MGANIQYLFVLCIVFVFFFAKMDYRFEKTRNKGCKMIYKGGKVNRLKKK